LGHSVYRNTAHTPEIEDENMQGQDSPRRQDEFDLQADFRV